VAVGFSIQGTFQLVDGQFASSGTFEATGAIVDSGAYSDTARHTGVEVHIDRTMTAAGGDIILMSINGNHVSGQNHDAPAWCPSPPPEDGTTIYPVVGSWSVPLATGRYSGLKANGDWMSWVYVDNGTGAPLSNVECLKGKAQFH
jgi:hypothetical protein